MAVNKNLLIYSRSKVGTTSILLLATWVLICIGAFPPHLHAQSDAPQLDENIVTRGVDADPNSGPYSPVDQSESPIQTEAGSTGVTIVPTFDSNAGTAIDAATQTVINNAIAFYQSTLSNNITVPIYFYNMSSGLGQSTFFIYTVSYSNYRNALGTHAVSADDVTALATTSAATNPVNGQANISVKGPNLLALGFNVTTPTFSSSPCPGFVGFGCIGINVTLANSKGDLTGVVEHEIDEILGLGSALSGSTTPTNIWPEDLFRWAGAGTRSYAANASCTSPPSAFFSIDGGATNANQFNNCNNGGDYGDWISHNPPHVQDAFAGNGAPTLNRNSSEIRALDVLGYTVVSKKVHGQLTSY